MSPQGRKAPTNTNTRGQNKAESNLLVQGSEVVQEGKAKTRKQPGSGALTFFKKVINDLNIVKHGKHKTWEQAYNFLLPKSGKSDKVSRWGYVIKDTGILKSLYAEGKLGNLLDDEESNLLTAILSVTPEMNPFGWLQELVKLGLIELAGEKVEIGVTEQLTELPDTERQVSVHSLLQKCEGDEQY